MGLELDAMVLADCEHGLLPLRLPGFGPLSAANAAEERRQFRRHDQGLQQAATHLSSALDQARLVRRTGRSPLLGDRPGGAQRGGTGSAANVLAANTLKYLQAELATGISDRAINQR